MTADGRLRPPVYVRGQRMYIKPLRSMHGSYGTIRRGVLVDIDDHIALALIRRGRAIPADLAKEAAKLAPEHPSQERRPGSRTGAAKRSSSSQEDRPSRTRRSKKSEDERE